MLATQDRLGFTTPAQGVRIDKPLLLVLSVLLIAVAAVHGVFDSRFDFGIFYYAAHMVLDGSRHVLYDLSTQRLFQARLHRPMELYFSNAPFVLIPFLPLAKLPIGIAFIPWTAASLALLVWNVRGLSGFAHLRYGNWPVLLSLAFMPVAACLANGQLSVLVLSGYVLAYSLWRKGHLFLGGLALALATFKFQLILGFVAVLVLKRKWREVAGFACGSAVFAGLSLAVVGPRTLFDYLLFIAHGGPNSHAKPSEMASWRGLLSLVGREHSPILVAALSLGTVLLAAYLWRDLDSGFVAGTLAAMLVSYHFNVEDLTLFLIPAFLGLKLIPKPRLFILSALLLPEILCAFGGTYALLAIPLALCLAVLYVTTKICVCVRVATGEPASSSSRLGNKIIDSPLKISTIAAPVDRSDPAAAAGLVREAH